MKRVLVTLPLIALFALAGCGSNKPKYANVKGKVTFNGKPLDKGQIIFSMDGYPPSAMEITDGAFNGQAMVGSNKISVSAKKKSATVAKLPKEAQIQIKGYQQKFKDNPNQGAGSASEYDPTAVDYIPPEWGTSSKEMRVVESGVTNDFEFNIKGKKE
ncbi:MAG: hypothetical protein U0798_08670 [Gemmataceae bacterium]